MNTTTSTPDVPAPIHACHSKSKTPWVIEYKGRHTPQQFERMREISQREDFDTFVVCGRETGPVNRFDPESVFDPEDIGRQKEKALKGKFPMTVLWYSKGDGLGNLNLWVVYQDGTIGRDIKN